MPEPMHFTLDEVKDAIAATIIWEREYDDELEYNEKLMSAVPLLPSNIPDDVKESVDEWVMTLRARQRERLNKLKNLQPDRQEGATILRAKLIQYKRKLLTELTEELMDGPRGN